MGGGSTATEFLKGQIASRSQPLELDLLDLSFERRARLQVAGAEAKPVVRPPVALDRGRVVGADCGDKLGEIALFPRRSDRQRASDVGGTRGKQHDRKDGQIRDSHGFLRGYGDDEVYP